MIRKNEHLDFLKKKIQEISLAKFSAHSDSLLQLPNNIITTLKTDNEGNIWFFTSCTGTYARNMDTSFYASLEYYNKESNFRLHIDGKATVVEDKDDMAPFFITKKTDSFIYNIVLIKLKILKAEYHETRQMVTSSFKETVRNIFVGLFYSNAHKQLNFFETVPTHLIS
jgi:general stress protein 26